MNTKIKIPAASEMTELMNREQPALRLYQWKLSSEVSCDVYVQEAGSFTLAQLLGLGNGLVYLSPFFQ